MDKKIFTLALVAIIGILLGVGVVKKQTREPILREILQKQQILLQSQMRIENKVSGEEGAIGMGDSRIAQKLQGLENRIAALETQLKGLPQAPNKARDAYEGPPPEDLSKVYDIPIDHSPVRGDKDAPVTIVEFVDFQCPFCARFHPPIKEVLKAYPKEVNYVLKNFPLPFHDHARPAASAAFAAGEQGKYWEMADALLENGNSLSEETFQKLAGDLGLDLAKFMDDYVNQNEKWEEYINKDLTLVPQVDARGTPTFYINGRKTNARDFNGLKKEIDQILNEKN